MVSEKEKAFNQKVKRFDRLFCEIVANIFVSAITTLAVLTVLGRL